jgi:hypothetical protein
MFSHGMKEQNQAQIEVKDWKYNSYLMMIEYLYTAGFQNFNPANAIDLLGLSDAYMLEGLKILCENKLMESIDSENVCSLLIHATRYSSMELKKSC